MSVRVVTTLRSSEDKLKSQTIYKAIFFKAYYDFVAMLFCFDVGNLLKLVVDHLCMSSSY